MTRKGRFRVRLLWLLIALAICVGGVYGGWRYLRWRHDEDIEARLNRLAPTIWKYAQANSLPPEFVREVIRAESGGLEHAQSSKNAKGLMQLTPIAIEEVRRKKGIPEGDPFDADYNIRVGTAYLRILMTQFDGDAWLALAAYSMGPTRLREARQTNPALSGREIVEKVAPAATVHYCRAILRGKEVHLPSRRRLTTEGTENTEGR